MFKATVYLSVNENIENEADTKITLLDNFVILLHIFLLLCGYNNSEY